MIFFPFISDYFLSCYILSQIFEKLFIYLDRDIQMLQSTKTLKKISSCNSEIFAECSMIYSNSNLYAAKKDEFYWLMLATVQLLSYALYKHWWKTLAILRVLYGLKMKTNSNLNIFRRSIMRWDNAIFLRQTISYLEIEMKLKFLWTTFARV